LWNSFFLLAGAVSFTENISQRVALAVIQTFGRAPIRVLNIVPAFFFLISSGLDYNLAVLPSKLFIRQILVFSSYADLIWLNGPFKQAYLLIGSGTVGNLDNTVYL
jgi:hypothetical protein